jgi:aldehyde dehydrogenase (NAD+)
MLGSEKLFVGGHWVGPSTDDRIEVVSPSTEEVVGHVPAGSVADIDRAVESARVAFDEGPWRWMAPAERAGYLRRIAANMLERVEETAWLITTEAGIPISAARGHAASPVAILNASADVGEKFAYRERRKGLAEECWLLREPVGVVAAISPWNGPLYLAASKLGPALAAGCSVVLKPAPETPLCANVLAEACAAADLPEGVVSIVPAGRQVGQHLVDHPAVDKVSFTGSTAAGRKIMASCAARMKRVTMELGGKSAGIVLPDVKAEDFAQRALVGATINTGQACALLSRMLVPRTRQNELVEALAAAISTLKQGDPFEEDTVLGPLVARRQRERVEDYIALGQQEGATVALGGGRPAHLPKGWYVEPTILVDVDNSMRIAQEEVFGPVTCFIPYDQDDDVVAMANDSPYGLHGAVFTDDLDRGVEIARRVRTGSFTVNGFCLDPAIPFGGYKQSGIGREGGPEGFAAYLETKALSVPEGYDLPFEGA